MPTVRKDIEAVIGEDVYLPYEAASTVDLDDWDSWEIETYIYKDGVLVHTCKAADLAIVKTAPGRFYSWLKSTISTEFVVGNYHWQSWRIDTVHKFCLHKGTLKMEPYGI